MPRSRALVISLASVLTFGLGAFGCGPPRVGFDVQNDVPQPDVISDDVDPNAMDAALDARDGSLDARDGASDAHACDPVTCDMACTSAGLAGGVCRTNMCQCLGGTDGGTDVVQRDVAPDVDVVVVVRFCTSPDAGAGDSGCAPSQFCNATSCSPTATGAFCAMRPDPTSCDPDGVPSCGCDGVLYPNTCARLAAGVRLDPMGGCRGGVADGGAADAARDAVPGG